MLGKRGLVSHVFGVVVIQGKNFAQFDTLKEGERKRVEMSMNISFGRHIGRHSRAENLNKTRG